MLVVVGGIKGGAGKTITATNLAVMRTAAGRDVLLVDGDDQESATLWAATRGEALGEANRITSVQLTGKSTRAELLKLVAKYDDVIVDAGGRDTTTQRAALTVAEMVVLPFPPRGPDIWTLDKVTAMLSEVRAVNEALRACAFINRADPKGADNDAAAGLLAEAEGIEVLAARLGNFKAFPNAFVEGLGVAELKPRHADAITGMKTLYQAIFGTDPV